MVLHFVTLYHVDEAILLIIIYSVHDELRDQCLRNLVYICIFFEIFFIVTNKR